MSEQVKTKRLLQVDVDFGRVVNVEQVANMTRLRFARENAPWLAALLREAADEISDAFGEG